VCVFALFVVLQRNKVRKQGRGEAQSLQMAGMAATLLAPALSAVVLGSVGISQNSVAKKTSPPVFLSLSGTSKSGGGGGYNGLNIRGARVGGVEIPNSKRIETALQYIHGVGATTARQILLDIGMENKLARELSEEDLTNLRDEVSKYMVEGDLVWTSLPPMTSTLLQNF
jgi:hypothetical protein